MYKYFAVSYLCLIATVRSQIPHQEIYNYCDPELKLCEVITDHVMCKYPVPGPSPRCIIPKPMPLNGTEKKKILFLHNRFRSFVAVGRERNKTGKLSTASNMRQIYWDPELETLAKRWADQCFSPTDPQKTDDCRNTKRFQVSQNVATREINETTMHKQVPLILIKWYRESRHLESSFNNTPVDEYLFRHFVNIMRAETYAMGCARVVFQEQNDRLFERVVCNYGPVETKMGLSLYKPGAYCSDCPPGTKCSTIYPGLCAAEGNLGDIGDQEATANDVTEGSEHMTGVSRGDMKDEVYTDTQEKTTTGEELRHLLVTLSTSSKIKTNDGKSSETTNSDSSISIDSTNNTNMYADINNRQRLNEIKKGLESSGVKHEVKSGVPLNGKCYCSNVRSRGQVRHSLTHLTPIFGFLFLYQLLSF